jgi:hypothetical protein
LLGCSFDVALVLHLPFANHVHQLDAGQNNARAPETPEPHHRLDNAFDGSMVLVG